MNTSKQIQALVSRVGAMPGFLEIRNVADIVVGKHAAEESLSIAKQLYMSDIYQARSLATFILGRLSSDSPESLDFLKQRVSADPDWRVQEILAKAFDRYCADTGYANALPTIKLWLADARANVRRAVTEGLRIWTGRPYFREHPRVAVEMLGALRADESVYVRKSVGNALRDISKKHGALVEAELDRWDISVTRAGHTHKLAVKYLRAASAARRPRGREVLRMPGTLDTGCERGTQRKKDHRNRQHNPHRAPDHGRKRDQL